MPLSDVLAQPALSSGFSWVWGKVFLCFRGGVGFRGKYPEGSSEK